MDNFLNEKEIQFIKRLYKNYTMSRYSYIAAAFLGTISILGFVLGVNFHNKDGFFMAIYFGTIAALLALKTKTERKVVEIIKKMEKSIERGATLL